MRLSKEDTQMYLDTFKHFTQRIRPDKEFYLDVNNGESLVEPEAHIPTKIRIEQFIDAGVRLKEFRKEQFHFQNDEKIDENFYDPTIDPDFDEMDAVDMANNVKENLQDSVNKATKKAKESKKDDKSTEKTGDKPDSATADSKQDNSDNRMDNEQSDKMVAK